MPDPDHQRACSIALIGQKFMGRAHSNAWSQAAKFFDLPRTPVLHTIAGQDQSTLAAFASKWGWKKWTANWRKITGDPEIDLVDVSTPNDLHAEMSIAMLEAGKHVACEKPLARNLAEARCMREAAQRAAARSSPSLPGRGSVGGSSAANMGFASPTPQPPPSREGGSAHTFVWFNYRRCPAVAFAHKLVKEGRLGRINHVRAQYLQSWGGPDTPMSWRFRREAAGSGAHGDLNAHIIDLARFITGEEITEIHGAIARTFINERLATGGSAPSVGSAGRQPATASRERSDVDDATLFLASMSKGAVASFEATRLATGHLNANRIEVNGEHGSIRFDFENMNVLEFFDADDAPALQGWRRIMCTRASEHPYAGNWWPDGHIIGYEHGFVHAAVDFLDACAKGGTVEPNFRDGVRSLRALEAAASSMETGARVPLQPY
jgi:predicted dehydrogenase